MSDGQKRAGKTNEPSPFVYTNYGLDQGKREWFDKYRDKINAGNRMTDTDLRYMPYSSWEKKSAIVRGDTKGNPAIRKSNHGWRNSKARTKEWLDKAVAYYKGKGKNVKRKNPSKAAEFLGHALHTLQDRYAHRRYLPFDGNGNPKKTKQGNYAWKHAFGNDKMNGPSDFWGHSVDPDIHSTYYDNWDYADEYTKSLAEKASKTLVLTFRKKAKVLLQIQGRVIL